MLLNQEDAIDYATGRACFAPARFAFWIRAGGDYTHHYFENRVPAFRYSDFDIRLLGLAGEKDVTPPCVLLKANAASDREVAWLFP